MDAIVLETWENEGGYVRDPQCPVCRAYLYGLTVNEALVIHGYCLAVLVIQRLSWVMA